MTNSSNATELATKYNLSRSYVINIAHGHERKLVM